jgi:hypothetical protein
VFYYCTRADRISYPIVSIMLRLRLGKGRLRPFTAYWGMAIACIRLNWKD